MFPSGHNQNRVREVMQQFLTASEAFPFSIAAPPATEPACRETSFGELSSSCKLFWCEAQWDAPAAEQDHCWCYRNDSATDCEEGTVVTAFHHIVGHASGTEGAVGNVLRPGDVAVVDLDGPLGDRFVAGGRRLQADDVVFVEARNESISQREMAPMFLHEWDSGLGHIQPVTSLQATLQRVHRGPCSWEEICFCGTYRCQLPKPWRLVAKNLSLSSSSHMRQHVSDGVVGGVGDRHRTWSVDPVDRATVDVAFGLLVDTELFEAFDSDKSWAFDWKFDLRRPWAQRHIVDFCLDLPSDLVVVETLCWLDDFRRHVLLKGLRWPVTPTLFNQEVMEYFRAGSVGRSRPSTDFVWVDSNEVKAMYLSFRINVAKSAPAGVALHHEALWEKRLSSFNNKFAVITGEAVHVSELWANARTQLELVRGAWLTFGVAMLLTIFITLLVTGDCWLCVLMALEAFTVVGGSGFLMTAVLRFSIGPIEVLGLVGFIGHSVALLLPVACSYSSREASQTVNIAEVKRARHVADQRRGDTFGRGVPTEICGQYQERSLIRESTFQFVDDFAKHPNTLVRQRRTMYALVATGRSMLGVVVPAVGCSFFLFFCKLIALKKLGGALLAVALLSMSIGLGTLPAALFCIGPLAPAQMFDSLIARVGDWSSNEDSWQSLWDAFEAFGGHQTKPTMKNRRHSLVKVRCRAEGIASEDATHDAAGKHGGKSGKSKGRKIGRGKGWGDGVDDNLGDPISDGSNKSGGAVGSGGVGCLADTSNPAIASGEHEGLPVAKPTTVAVAQDNCKAPSPFSERLEAASAAVAAMAAERRGVSPTATTIGAMRRAQAKRHGGGGGRSGSRG
eukprot:TRINITY_DN19217_c0_g2_i1.p1 TRINITY_DN19217_c0_g2~~TRINITY_DN19217_c0_g2_i1.p1  ORF type:complete len:980 (-),score=193.58 TRINITY_DN19217_c0_g2_i1:22-2559(-)